MRLYEILEKANKDQILRFTDWNARLLNARDGFDCQEAVYHRVLDKTFDIRQAIHFVDVLCAKVRLMAFHKNKTLSFADRKALKNKLLKNQLRYLRVIEKTS